MAEFLAIDREKSAERIERDVETLAGPDYTLSSEAIRRYAYTQVYRNTLDYFTRELEALDFQIEEDPVGTFVARNRPKGTKVFGVGSHCDSNRNGGKYDGTLGVVTALEVCRLSRELGLDLGLQLMAFVEEEASGFNQGMLGSRVAAQWVTEQDLRELRAIDDGRTFWEHAQEAGYEPERWRESARILDDLSGWIEPHIEQGPILDQSGDRIGIVSSIVGYVFGDITVRGRASHAGGTPMDGRLDAGVVAAECILELERMASAAGHGTVGTVGDIAFSPSLVNAVPGEARFSLDIRSVDEDAFRGVARGIVAFAEEAARRRGMSAEYAERYDAVLPTRMDDRIMKALEEAAKASGEPYRVIPSRGAHDTQCVAARAPVAMVFVPCKDGVSHSPLEEARPEDAALAAEIILNAIRALV